MIVFGVEGNFVARRQAVGHGEPPGQKGIISFTYKLGKLGVILQAAGTICKSGPLVYLLCTF